MKFNIVHIFLGLKKEHRRVRWLPLENLWPLTFIVLGFSLAFGIYFIGVDVIINWFIKLLKVSN